MEPQEDTTEKMQIAERKLALLLQKTISDITLDTNEVSWNALDVSLGISEHSPEHAKAQPVGEHVVSLAQSVFDLWKSQRDDTRVAKDGYVVTVLLEDLLQRLDL